MNFEKAIALKSSRVPKMMADLIHSNQFLKIFSLMSFVLSIMILMILSYQLSKEPLVLAFNPGGSYLSETSVPDAEVQIQEGLKAYLKFRYRWEPKTIQSQMSESANFVSTSSSKAFWSSVNKIIDFSKEKNVSQKTFPEDLKVDLQNKIALVYGERITTIQGLSASGPLRLKLQFDYGERTEKNPWGVYIVKEKEL